MTKEEIGKFTGGTGLYLSEAMRIIDKNANGIIFLLNDDGTLAA